MANNTGLYYVTIEGFIKWVSNNLAGVLSNDNVNSFSIGQNEEDTIKEALLHAESKVDGYLKKRGYKVPVDAKYERTHNLLRIYVNNISSYELYGRRGITKERYYKYQRNIQSLKDIANGEEHLPDDVPFSNGEKITHGNTMTSPFTETNINRKLSI